MAQTNVADENPLRLEGILMLFEEGVVSNVDETLAWVLKFYGRFVPPN
jgi:hypothetical protein